MNIKEKTMAHVFIVPIILVLGLIAFGGDAKRENFLKVSDCVQTTAEEQGYKGHWNSVESWETFAPNCRLSI